MHLGRSRINVSLEEELEDLKVPDLEEAREEITVVSDGGYYPLEVQSESRTRVARLFANLESEGVYHAQRLRFEKGSCELSDVLDEGELEELTGINKEILKSRVAEFYRYVENKTNEFISPAALLYALRASSKKQGLTRMEVSKMLYLSEKSFEELLKAGVVRMGAGGIELESVAQQQADLYFEAFAWLGENNFEVPQIDSVRDRKITVQQKSSQRSGVVREVIASRNPDGSYALSLILSNGASLPAELRYVSEKDVVKASIATAKKELASLVYPDILRNGEGQRWRNVLPELRICYSVEGEQLEIIGMYNPEEGECAKLYPKQYSVDPKKEVGKQGKELTRVYDLKRIESVAGIRAGSISEDLKETLVRTGILEMEARRVYIKPENVERLKSFYKRYERR